MTSYSEIDPVIFKWVKALGTTLCTECAGEAARFFYTPGDPPFECFQICIAPPQAGLIVVHAGAVDTNDDTDDEMQESWTGSIEDIDNMLAVAVDTINKWKRRARKKPDPPSPW